MIDIAPTKACFEAIAPVLNERGGGAWRLFAASEAPATAIARSTNGRGLPDLGSATVMLGSRVRHSGGGGNPATETQPWILPALKRLVQPSIRGDPEAALLGGVERSPGHGAGDG